MKILVAISFLFLTFISTAQSFEFKPDWKKGEVKELLIVQNKKEFENDVLISDTTYFNDSKLTVLKETKTEFLLELVAENQTLEALYYALEQSGEKMEYGTDLNFLFTVNKKTAEIKLQNWTEIQDFLISSLDEISRLFNKQNPDHPINLDPVFDPLKITFEKEENVIAILSGYVEFIFIPYEQEVSLNEPVIYTKTGPNPFDPSKEMPYTEITTLKYIDNKNKVYGIEQETVIDKSAFEEMIKRTMESIIPKDSISFFGLDNIADIEIGMTNSNSILFNNDIKWVEKSVDIFTINLYDPTDGKRYRKERTTVAILK